MAANYNAPLFAPKPMVPAKEFMTEGVNIIRRLGAEPANFAAKPFLLPAPNPWR